MFRKVSLPTDWHNYSEERLSAYVDGRLSDDERANVRKHLQQCERCQANLDSLGWAIKLVKQVPAPPLPRQFTLAVPATKPVPATGFMSANWFKLSLAAASVTAVLVLGFWITLDLISPQSGETNLAFAPAAAATMVAVSTPTSSGANERAVAPAVAPSPVASDLALQPTPTLSLAESAQPTETPSQETAKSVSPAPTLVNRLGSLGTATATCSGCGLGGGNTQTDHANPPVAQAATVSAPVATGTVNTTIRLWVHTDASESSKRVGSMLPNVTVKVFGRNATGDWLEILFPLNNTQGRRGWVSSQFISNLSLSINDLPLIE